MKYTCLKFCGHDDTTLSNDVQPLYSILDVFDQLQLERNSYTFKYHYE